LNCHTDHAKAASQAKTTTSQGIAFMVKEVQENPAVDKCGFILDSGASDHLINDESLYIDSVELVPPLKSAVAKQGEYIYAS